MLVFSDTRRIIWTKQHPWSWQPARNGNRDKPGRRLRPLLLNTENPLENISTANGDRM
jgi:hypothetical protein